MYEFVAICLDTQTEVSNQKELFLRVATAYNLMLITYDFLLEIAIAFSNLKQSIIKSTIYNFFYHSAQVVFYTKFLNFNGDSAFRAFGSRAGDRGFSPGCERPV